MASIGTLGAHITGKTEISQDLLLITMEHQTSDAGISVTTIDFVILKMNIAQFDTAQNVKCEQ